MASELVNIWRTRIPEIKGSDTIKYNFHRGDYMSLVMRKPVVFAYAKTKTQISFAVTAKLISAFVFATRIVQSLYFLNPKFQVSRHILWLHSPVCVGPGKKPEDRHSHNEAHISISEELKSIDCGQLQDLNAQ